MLINLRFPRSYRYRWSYLFTQVRHRWLRVGKRLLTIYQILLLLSTLYVLLLINDRKHPFIPHAHTITPSSISFTTAHLTTTNETPPSPYLSPTAASSFCRAHRFSPLLTPPNTPRRKVYDLFLLNTELDWLEIRLATLYPIVDYFVIIESPITFTGHPKPLHLKENWARFVPYHNKIIHHVLQHAPTNAKRTWDVEDFQRNAMFAQTFPRMYGERVAHEGDVIVVSDVDEIPRPATMVLLRNCAVSKRVTIRSLFYYYGFQWLHAGPQWGHGQATIYTGDMGTTILPADLRNGEGGGVNWLWVRRWWESSTIWNAGWHCSTCFERVGDVLGKMGSFSHTGLNQEGFRDKERIVQRVRKGKDLWDRKGEVFVRVDGNEDVPEVLKGDRNKWAYLLDRDGENAGFVDYEKGG